MLCLFAENQIENKKEFSPKVAGKNIKKLTGQFRHNFLEAVGAHRVEQVQEQQKTTSSVQPPHGEQPAHKQTGAPQVGKGGRESGRVETLQIKNAPFRSRLALTC